MEHNRCIIIAEAGVNHNGDPALAKQMVDVAKNAGVDYIKFQTFIPRELVTGDAEKADYQKRETGGNDSQLQMLKKLALPDEAFWELREYCDAVGIGFLSTPFDLNSIDFLAGLNMDYWKVPSGEITDLPYLEKIAETGKRVILSTGMSGMDEIAAALDVLERKGSGEITLLHCNTEYPTPFADVNLLAMKEMGDRFHRSVGYSDHTLGIEVPIAAVALGAKVIEKHFTLDQTMEGPDHKASLMPGKLKEMVQAVRNIETALGDGRKRCSASETNNMRTVRKSIVAAVKIKKGELFTEENVTTKRPGDGLSPMRWHELIGKRARRDYWPDELIEKEEMDVPDRHGYGDTGGIRLVKTIDGKNRK